MEDFEDSNFSSKQKENIRSTNIQEIDTTYQNNFKIWSPPALNGLKFGNCYSLSTTKGISLFNFVKFFFLTFLIILIVQFKLRICNFIIN